MRLLLRRRAPEARRGTVASPFSTNSAPGSKGTVAKRMRATASPSGLPSRDSAKNSVSTCARAAVAPRLVTVTSIAKRAFSAETSGVHHRAPMANLHGRGLGQPPRGGRGQRLGTNAQTRAGCRAG